MYLFYSLPLREKFLGDVRVPISIRGREGIENACNLQTHPQQLCYTVNVLVG